MRPPTQSNMEAFRIFVEGMPDFVVFMLDTGGKISSWSKAAEDLTGYFESEITGNPVSVLFADSDGGAPKPQSSLELAKRTGRTETEGWCVHKNGTRYQSHTTITALRDEHGDLVGFGVLMRNETKERNADYVKRLNEDLETKLQKSQTEISDYKHALDESSIVAITDQKGIIQHVNGNFCKISKYSKEELLGQDHRIINSGFHPKEFIRNLWVTIANGYIWRGELKNKAKDGTYYWVDTTIVPFLNEKGKPYQYLAIRSDITSRKLAEEKLYKINDELEHKIQQRTLELTEALEREKELSEMKSRFVSLASHEFRTPLSAILSSTSLLEYYKAEEQEEKRRKHIDRIKTCVKNLTGILDDFLSLDKLEQGKIEIKMEDFNFHELIEDVMDEMSGMLKKKEQSIQFLYTGELQVHQDKKILRNVLLNLLSNAIKYSGEGKLIQLTADVHEPDITFTVRDEGIGIPLRAQKDLFGKFFRAQNAVHIQGTGLGLNIVKRYVELLEGKIGFVSLEGEGSTFTVRVPLNK
ncbi:MAG TPA: PAS domain-containing protein [Flavisolibacter sp.]|nr:PAS domain-containing protein [Flavisolibacter sp.]